MTNPDGGQITVTLVSKVSARNPSNAGTPSLDQILDRLTNEVLLGKSYLAIAQGLSTADPAVLQTAGAFFGLTIEGSLQLAQMIVARLYDRSKGAVTVTFMLDKAAGTGGSPQTQMAEAIDDSKLRIERMTPILESIRRRRNKWLAHLDPETVANPRRLLQTASLTIPELAQVFKETSEILNRVQILSNVMVNFDPFWIDDYEMALKLIADAKRAQADAYERKFGRPGVDASG
jgi:hypothetical protein